MASEVRPFENLKICGLTSREAARFCAEHGIGAVGVVFYPASPRHVTPELAHEVLHDLPAGVARVGVFVDMSLPEVLATAATASLTTIQLHGSEDHDMIRAVMTAGYRVVKVLQVTGSALLRAAAALPPGCGIMIECGSGALPGGNAAVWQWSEAAILGQGMWPAAAELSAGRDRQRRSPPFALAGGLTPANIGAAIAASHATAWDVSSGVEVRPGIKEPVKIMQLLAALERAGQCNRQRSPFWR